MTAFITSLSVDSWKRGFLAGIGALSADGVLAVIVFGLSSAIDLGAHVRYVYILGAVVMVGFGLLILRSHESAAPFGRPGWQVYLQGFGLGLGNPFQIVWWFSAGLAFAYAGGALLFAGLFGAIVAYVLGFTLLIHKGVGRHPPTRRWIILGSAALIFAFGGYFVFLAVGGV
ncbi:lysine exporter protein LysE/YggA [mine drainage metagenome]|uniref:Lysine exporter protein LysE/YggA n=1 Tax=mine drainage metagenome TaxID=410659 RepID=T1BLN0_9ZZZZ